MCDIAIRQALRQLRLTPDAIDIATAAVYAHARDPINNPVDEELARLCMSEYVRGGLHALSWYTAAAWSAAKEGNEDNTHVDLNAHFAEQLGASGSVSASGKDSKMGGESRPFATVRENGQPTSLQAAGGGHIPRDTMTDKISTIWNRLRRTNSMPLKDNRDVVYTGNVDDDIHDIQGRRRHRLLAVARVESPCTPDSGAAATSNCSNLARLLEARVSSNSRNSSLLATLCLGSPHKRRDGCEVTCRRREPVQTGRWKLGHEIGKGSYGVVHIGLHQDTGDLIAVKIISIRSAESAEPLYREIELMRNLKHPNIVRYLGAEVNDTEKTLSIFQEWVPGSVTTLLVNFGPFSDRRIASYTQQILKGLEYLHTQRVIHRDIKGGNILIDDRGVVKLCDFGASKMLDAKSVTVAGGHTCVGSPLFMAPEILLRQDYGSKVDIWSLGGAVLEMATGHPPWHTLNLRTPVALINWVKCTDGPPPLPESLSPPLTAFLMRCFERDPAERATAKQLLSDPFVTRRHETVPRSSASDADNVSEIDHLSRAAAIARISQASCLDSRHDSEGSSFTSPKASRCSPRSDQQFRRESRSPKEAGSQRPSDGAETNECSPARARASLVSEKRSSALARQLQLRVVTSGLGPPCTPCITPPPTRRTSLGRGGSVSPNPFAGRRRSFEQSPDGSRSSWRSSPRTPTPTGQQGACLGGWKKGGGEEGGGCDGAAAREGVGRGRAVAATGHVGSAMADKNVGTFTLTTGVKNDRGSRACPAFKRSDSIVSYGSNTNSTTSISTSDEERVAAERGRRKGDTDTRRGTTLVRRKSRQRHHQVESHRSQRDLVEEADLVLSQAK